MYWRTFLLSRAAAAVAEAGAAAAVFAAEAGAVGGGRLFRVLGNVGGNLGRTCA